MANEHLVRGPVAGTSLRPAAAELAVTAAAVVEMDLVGVDLLPLGSDHDGVIELNAAVEFDEGYSLDGRDVYAEAAAALDLSRVTAKTSS